MLLHQQVGPFTVEKELGSGAMGTVYLARYEKTGQRVALKLMMPSLGANEKALARFEREAAILKQLRHPNIVRLFGSGRFQKSPYFAMEYIEGETLDTVLRRRDRYTWEEVVDIGRQVCAALQHAHQSGVVHRDLKPSNLMITKSGTIKLTDFGIAKDLDVTQLTSAQCTVGTAAYMSPEQCRGDRDIGHKSDLYSLGVMLYELLVGRRPFNAENAMDMFMQHVKGKFERPSRIRMDIPVWLDTLVCQLLEKKPEQRPLDAAMVAKSLNEIQEKVGTLKSAGVDIATKVSRRAMDETDRRAAKTLLTATGQFRKKKKKRGEKSPPIWLTAAGLLLGLAGIVGIITYAVWPDSPEQLLAKGEKLVAKADATFDAGDHDTAWYIWSDARTDYFNRIIDHPSAGDLVEKARQRVRYIEAAHLYMAGHKFLARKDPNWQKAKTAGFGQLLDDPQFTGVADKYVNLAREELQPHEAPALLEEAMKLAESKKPKDEQEARLIFATLFRRYGNSDEAKKAEPTYLRLYAHEVALAKLEEARKTKQPRQRSLNRAEELALTALELEESKQADRAQLVWADLSRMPVETPEFRPWVLLARDRVPPEKK